ncbi:hypothetical protein JFV29_15425 [Peribacillus sp. TH16]|uniref:hypothetical protein n=1 Tax=Peribacillus sp. TH16 TaxID=2798482 RepID=UPI001913868E|nr:hypothetical protein [Peribacillus sp. TH16]MBK5483244.1 hypothetical protein [Peribacillus sp. TH16]
MTYAVIILVIGIIIAIFLSIKKPNKSKYSIWGITIMFPILFIAGVVLFWIGD